MNRNIAILATAALCSIIMSENASAADILYSHPQDILYSRQPVAFWSGFYGGLNVGYGWAQWSADVSDVTAGTSGSGSTNVDGVIGGVQFGYNQQLGNFVFGVETDIQASGQRHSENWIVGGTVLTGTANQDWFGTARLRAGAMIGNGLLYATGGATYGDYRLSATATGALVGSASIKWTRAGWVVGGGYEARLNREWSAKLEYLYLRTDWSDTQTIGADTFNANLRSANNVVRLGVNYKLSDYYH